MANVTLRPHYQVINGIRFPSQFSPTCIKEALSYKPKPEDIFIVTYPKCGTTWMQDIILYIFRKGKELENYNHEEYYKTFPFIDMVGYEGIDRMYHPAAIKTHLPYTSMPYSPFSKYIYVLRNPKDCCVSMYFHTKGDCGFGYWDGKFEDFFELFIAGEVEYNDYFDHMISWYPHCYDSQVFFTTYEEMKCNTKSVVLKLAAFLGKEYIEIIEKDNNVLNNILHFSSFEYMKRNASQLHNSQRIREKELNSSDMCEGKKYMLKYGRLLNPPDTEKIDFLRKGIVGDWKNFLNEDQSERLGKKFIERTKGTDIFDMYISLM